MATIMTVQFKPTTFSISNFSYDSVSASLDTLIGSNQTWDGMSARPDGTVFFAVANGSDTIYQFDLSSGWDLTTISDSGNSFGLSSAGTVSATGIFVRPDGSQMFIADATGSEVWRYTIDTPWDVSSGSFTGVQTESLSEVPANQLQDIHFNPTGTKMYALRGLTTRRVYQYTLSTPWDLTTLSYDSVFLNIDPQTSGARGITFTDDGKSIFVIDISADEIFQYDLPTPWELTSGAYTGNSLATSPNSTPTGVVMGNSNSTIFTIDLAQSVFQYSL